jgi:hypothetical protein
MILRQRSKKNQPQNSATTSIDKRAYSSGHDSGADRRQRRRLAMKDFEGHKQHCRLLKTAAGGSQIWEDARAPINTLSLAQVSCLV